MIDKLNTTMINKGTRKKRQREINRDETRRVSLLADEAEEWYSIECTYEKIALEANYAGLYG